jgi:hypothetical protein
MNSPLSAGRLAGSFEKSNSRRRRARINADKSFGFFDLSSALIGVPRRLYSLHVFSPVPKGTGRALDFHRRLGHITHPRSVPMGKLLKILARFLEDGMHALSLNYATMPRFDQLIRRDMIVRDVKQIHPATVPIFEALRFRSSCDDCSIDTVARKNGLAVQDVLDSLNQAAFTPEKDSDDAR